MSIVQGQPEIRFNAAGPYGVQGKSYLPKVILIDKLITTAEGYEDVITFPAGTYVDDVFAVALDGTGNTTTEISLGSTSSTQALLSAFNPQTDNNATHSSTGLYFGAAGALRLTVGGTAAAGQVRIAVSYFELASMAASGIHFSL